MTELVQELSEQPLPPGPSEYAGLFRWPEEFWRRLHGLLPAEILESNVRNHGQIYMTSHFSGVGTAEMALAMIQSFFRRSGIWPGESSQSSDSDAPAPTPVVFHSSCDSDKICQDVLKAHHSVSRCQHLFGDVCSAAPGHVVKLLEDKLRSLQSKFLAQSFSSNEDKIQERVALEKRMHAFAVKLLDSEPMNNACHCLVHGRQCNLFPTAESTDHRMLFHIEVAGSPCIAFVRGGAYGTALRWLHEVTVPFYIWLFSVKKAKPAMIVHECVPGFDVNVVDAGLNSQGLCYHVQSLVFSPEEEGVPIKRQRRYTLGLRSDLCPPLLKFDAATWRCVAFAERVATAEMYFQASKELLSVWKKTLARRQALPDRPTFAKQDEDWCWQALLTSTERLLVNEIRNENLKEIADIEAQMKSLDPFDPERQEYENTIAGKHRWLVNVSQSKGFQPKCSNHRLLIMPALLRSAKFFIDGENVSESRLVHPLELMAMQSLPVLLPQTLQDLHGLNFESVLSAANVHAQNLTGLAGNGMHVSSVGKTLMFGLAVIMSDCTV